MALGGKTLEDFPEIEQTCRDLSNSGEFIAHALALLLDLEGKRNNAQECRRVRRLISDRRADKVLDNLSYLLHAALDMHTIRRT